MNISKNMNKILLTIIACAAVNQTFTSEPIKDKIADAKEDAKDFVAGAKAKADTTVENVKTATAIYEEKSKAFNDAKELSWKKGKNLAAEKIKNESVMTPEERETHAVTLKTLEEEFNVSVKALEVKKIEMDTAWKVLPLLAKGCQYGTLYFCGGALITKFGLTGYSATAVKIVSAGTITALAVYAAIKGYNYLFEDEVEDDEDTF